MALPVRPTRTAPAPGGTTPPHASWLMLAVLLLGQFMCIIDVLVTNVAMPSIAASLHASGASLQLVVGGYTIAYAMLLITGARLGDRYGRRRTYLAGVLIFTTASLACALAPDSQALIGFRLVQGAGAAVLVPQVFSIIQLNFSGPARARALSAYAAVLSAGAVTGLVLGGVVVTADLFGTGWRPVFAINVPIGIVLAAAVPRLVPPGRPTRPACSPPPCSSASCWAWPPSAPSTSPAPAPPPPPRPRPCLAPPSGWPPCPPPACWPPRSCSAPHDAGDLDTERSGVTPSRRGTPGTGISAGAPLRRRAWLDKFTDVKAMSVIPGRPGSELVAELPDPPSEDGSVLVEGLLAGICGTDAEVLRGGGQPPAGRRRLVIGHESLGRVLEAPADAPVRPGDLVAGMVRRPDPVPCPACASGQPDFCVNGRYTERGIKGLDGYGATRWRVSPRFAIAVPDQLADLGVLTEPGSVVAKAWEQIDRLVLRAPTEPRTDRLALVTGAGPIGMLAALLGLQRGYQVHVFDRVAAGPKPALVAALGATYHHGPAGTLEALDLCPDVALECTGAGELVIELAGKLAPAGVMCLIGISSGQRRVPVDMSRVGASMVLGNSLVFGTVSAARRHYEQAAGALARADPAWLGGLISRRVPLSGWQQGLARQPGDVKVVVDLTQ